MTRLPASTSFPSSMRKLCGRGAKRTGPGGASRRHVQPDSQLASPRLLWGAGHAHLEDGEKWLTRGRLFPVYEVRAPESRRGRVSRRPLAMAAVLLSLAWGGFSARACMPWHVARRLFSQQQVCAMAPQGRFNRAPARAPMEGTL